MALRESLKLVGRAALGQMGSTLGDVGFQTPAGCVYLGVQDWERGKLVACCGYDGQGRHPDKDGG